MTSRRVPQRAEPEPLAHDATPATRRPLVLLEMAAPVAARAVEAMLEGDCYDVVWCPGPAATGECCPLVGRGECVMAECCDVVVFALGLGDARCKEVLVALERRYPDTPIVVALPLPALTRWSPLVAGHRVVAAPLTTTSSLLRAVGDAVAGRVVTDHSAGDTRTVPINGPVLRGRRPRVA